MKRNIQIDMNNMMKDYIGERGIDKDRISPLLPALRYAHNSVEAARGKGMQGWMDLPHCQEEIVASVEASAARIREKFDAFVVLGIGGSALGPMAVHQALSHLHYNELSRKARGGPKLYIEDNIDPERMAALLSVIDIKKTCFNVVTKSGGTAETMSQYLIVLDLLKKAVGDEYKNHIVATTSASKGYLIEIARQEGYETFFIPEGVGGRFSVLCPVGLLPAAVCGIDIRSLLAGAAAMDERCRLSEAWDNPALLSAALMYIAMENGANISVMMPYADSLKLMSDWYAQLWAESLGKNVTLDGKPVNVGQTPVKALGVTDQHSQLQLFTEGPYDKVITFLKVENFRSETPIPHGCENIETIAFLGGKTHSRLIEAEREGTEYALFKAGRMSQTITLPEVNAHTVGELIYFYELVTAYTGALLNIDTFNQPGVEESKIASYAVMGYQSELYDQKRAEMDERPERNPKFIL